MCFFFQAEDGIRDVAVTGVQTCALPIFYAAAAFNEHNPWWLVMPDVTRYLQRMSLLLRQGNPANDVALLLPTDDAWAQFTATLSGLPGESRTDLPPPGASISVNQTIAAMLGGEAISQVLDAGFNFDFIDAEAIEIGRASCRERV